jgi:transposase InsO family protein
MLHVAGAPAKQDHAMSAIKNFQAGVEVDPRRKLKILRTDCVGRFTSVEFGRYCAERGVHHQLTTPYSPQRNGLVERQNHTVVAMARCMLKTKNLSGHFWGEAVTTAIYILNRALMRALDGKTPFEA